MYMQNMTIVRRVFSFMTISKKVLENYKRAEVVAIDPQILFLCKNGMFDKVNLFTLYQQFKSAITLKDFDAYNVYKEVLKNWLEDNEIKILENAL